MVKNVNGQRKGKMRGGANVKRGGVVDRETRCSF